MNRHEVAAHIKPVNDIDLADAEEALRLASRLQDEARSRISIDELHCIADEAGIDPAFVDQALASKPQSRTEEARKPITWHAVLLPVGVVFCQLASVHFGSIVGPPLVGPKEDWIIFNLIGLFLCYQLGSSRPNDERVRQAGIIAIWVAFASSLFFSHRVWDLSVTAFSTVSTFLYFLASLSCFYIGQRKTRQ